MRLADSLEEQAALEAILEESKPPLPAGGAAAALPARHALSLPPAARLALSRRARGRASGTAPKSLRTALAEKSYWRLRFLLDSPGTPDLKAVPHTAFRAAVRSRRGARSHARAVRARARRLDHRARATQGTQAFAAAARAAQIEIIRYESVRDPQHAACAAVLDPAAFGRGQPRAPRPGSSPPRASGCVARARRAAGRPGNSARAQLLRRVTSAVSAPGGRAPCAGVTSAITPKAG